MGAGHTLINSIEPWHGLPGELPTFPVNSKKTRSFSVTKRAGVTWLRSFSDHAELDVARSSEQRNKFYWLSPRKAATLASPSTF